MIPMDNLLPLTGWLATSAHQKSFMDWNTFFRRNPHLFAKYYLGLKLFTYQQIILWGLFQSDNAIIEAARAAAKSFILAVYCVVRAILYPGTHIVIASSTRKQAALIISEKILKELCSMSPMLRREIKSSKDNQLETSVTFHNGSFIEIVTLSDTARGHRAHVIVIDEGRNILDDGEVVKKVIVPFLISRQPEFSRLPEYNGRKEFIEEPVQIQISSSTDDQHWLSKASVNAMKGMLSGDGSVFFALDYAICLKHGIRTRKQMITAYRDADPITRMTEYDNIMMRQGSMSFFTYTELRNRQVIPRPFYPKTTDEYITKAKLLNPLTKQDGEIRIVSADFAAVNRSGNDNSAFSLLRLLPDIGEDGHKVYRVQIVYLEAFKGTEIRSQAIRLQQLRNDFGAQYMVLDLRNIGVAVYDMLARVLYDDARGVEYKPIRCMNDATIAARINNPSAEECVFVINATAKLNSEMVMNFKAMLMEKLIEFLIPRDDGIDEIRRFIPDYLKTSDPDVRFRYEAPYLETMLMISEMATLQYDRAPSTGLIRVFEQGNNTKDRWSSVEMGAYFASLLARDLLNESDEGAFEDAPLLVSAVNFD